MTLLSRVILCCKREKLGKLSQVGSQSAREAHRQADAGLRSVLFDLPEVALLDSGALREPVLREPGCFPTASERRNWSTALSHR